MPHVPALQNDILLLWPDSTVHQMLTSTQSLYLFLSPSLSRSLPFLPSSSLSLHSTFSLPFAPSLLSPSFFVSFLSLSTVDRLSARLTGTVVVHALWASVDVIWQGRLEGGWMYGRWKVARGGEWPGLIGIVLTKMELESLPDLAGG